MDTKISKCSEIVLNAGQSTTWWWTWSYINSGRWVRFSANPVSDNGKVEVTRQWGERDIYGNHKWLTTFKNVGTTTVRLRPYVVCMRP